MARPSAGSSLQGRDFSGASLTDSTGLVLNEAAVKYMGLRDLGRRDGPMGWKAFSTSLGVIRDMPAGWSRSREPVHQVIHYPARRADTHFIIARLQPEVFPVRTSLARIRVRFFKSMCRRRCSSIHSWMRNTIRSSPLKKGRESWRDSLLSFAVFISCLGDLAWLPLWRRTADEGNRHQEGIGA